MTRAQSGTRYRSWSRSTLTGGIPLTPRGAGFDPLPLPAPHRPEQSWPGSSKTAEKTQFSAFRDNFTSRQYTSMTRAQSGTRYRSWSRSTLTGGIPLTPRGAGFDPLPLPAPHRPEQSWPGSSKTAEKTQFSAFRGNFTSRQYTSMTRAQAGTRYRSWSRSTLTGGIPLTPRGAGFDPPLPAPHRPEQSWPGSSKTAEKTQFSAFRGNFTSRQYTSMTRAQAGTRSTFTEGLYRRVQC
ncbi:hypothetical protein CAQUA_06445 [Corynebacterium aquatimens]|uniref:CRISPR/Cas system-associated endoribonuclease Cas2 n=1 Tax=Corynebacterium aquatimens TaxID=1190508 RepID=A0A931DZC2_9CORY|nr:CRISPR/Cas system-associated endoribonuclease Cas2 [Corynebacterium aquatimens]WJY65993.1 hypothetical protein CAQUA_06445 [Corynebacterium aquatimens]